MSADRFTLDGDILFQDGYAVCRISRHGIADMPRIDAGEMLSLRERIVAALNRSAPSATKAAPEGEATTPVAWLIADQGGAVFTTLDSEEADRFAADVGWTVKPLGVIGPSERADEEDRLFRNAIAQHHEISTSQAEFFAVLAERTAVVVFLAQELGGEADGLIRAIESGAHLGGKP